MKNNRHQRPFQNGTTGRRDQARRARRAPYLWESKDAGKPMLDGARKLEQSVRHTHWMKGLTMKQIIPLARLALAALLLSGTWCSLEAAPPNTGVEGRAALYISYGTPVEVEPGVWISVGDVMMPVVTSFTVFSAHSGHEVGRFSTDAEGGFSVALPPGRYVIVPDTLTVGAFPFAQTVSTGPAEVIVSAKKFTWSLILYYHHGPFSVGPGTNEEQP